MSLPASLVIHRSSVICERNKQLRRHHKLRGAMTQSHLFRAGNEGEGQDTLYFDRSAIEDRRIKNPPASRLYSRVSQREVTADGCSLNDKPYFRDGNFHLDCPCGVHLPGVRRIDWVDSGNSAALQHTF